MFNVKSEKEIIKAQAREQYDLGPELDKECGIELL